MPIGQIIEDAAPSRPDILPSKGAMSGFIAPLCPSPRLLHFVFLLVVQFDRYRKSVTLSAKKACAGHEQD
jgi:hypothetical protein